MALFFMNFVLLICFLILSTELTDSRLAGTPTLCFFRRSDLVNEGLINFWLYVVGWFPLWMCSTLLYLKSDQDMLQGISKLDNLLKISCFQKYKEGTLENRKFSLVTSVNEELGESSSHSIASSQYAQLIHNKSSSLASSGLN